MARKNQGLRQDRSGCLEVVAITVFFVGLALAVAFCKPRSAHAALPTPSPDVVEQVNRGLGVNIAGIIGAAVIVGFALFVALRSMRKHEN